MLELIGPGFVNELTSSSALSLVYDTRVLSHTVIFLFESNQLQAEKQADRDSMFAMLVRTLISEGRIVHQTTVEDPNSPTGRRVQSISGVGRLPDNVALRSSSPSVKESLPSLIFPLVESPPLVMVLSDPSGDQVERGVAA